MDEFFLWSAFWSYVTDDVAHNGLSPFCSTASVTIVSGLPEGTDD